MNAADPEERSGLAGEYVLGTLVGAERDEFERAMAADAALRAEVAAWQDRLLGLVRHAAPSEPSPALWARIEADLPRSVSAATAATPAATPSRREPRPMLRPTPSAEPWWRRLVVWQGLTAAALAASVFFAVLLLQQPAGEAAQYLALLQSPTDAHTGWIVEARAGGALKLVPLGATEPVPAGRALQFWTKPDGAAGPTSLGLVRAGGSVNIPVAQLPGLGPKQLFEITLEPEGGSTIGKPTGPILFVGRTVRL